MRKETKARRTDFSRETKEVSLTGSIDIDGTGRKKIDTKIGFLDHMLSTFSEYSSFDIELKADGDTNIDYHHTVEEVGIVLGESIKRVCGTDIERFASCIIPHDETLVLFSLDISGRSGFFVRGFENFEAKEYKYITYIFFEALCRAGGFTIHIRVIEGENPHHIAEAIFKSAGTCFKNAVVIKGRNTPTSLKGYIYNEKA